MKARREVATKRPENFIVSTCGLFRCLGFLKSLVLRGERLRDLEVKHSSYISKTFV